MKAEELRIGNLVREPFYESYETEEFVTVDCIEVDNNWKDYEPIPLTEEWLLKMGFEKDNIDSDDYHWELEKFDRKVLIYSQLNCDSEVYTLSCSRIYYYVHEVQNLYYALTKEELKFEL